MSAPTVISGQDRRLEQASVNVRAVPSVRAAAPAPAPLAPSDALEMLVLTHVVREPSLRTVLSADIAALAVLLPTIARSISRFQFLGTLGHLIRQFFPTTRLADGVKSTGDGVVFKLIWQMLQRESWRSAQQL